jgi:selenocysteine lyase/cysteine desulfurase
MLEAVWNPADLRRLVSGAEEVAYFQTSGHSLKLTPALEETIHWLRFQSQGPALPAIGERMRQMLDATRARVARTVNADASEIMLNENTTVGINLVANGVDWRPGDVVILTTHEHPGNRLPWYNAAQRYGVELRFLAPPPDDDQFAQALDDLIDARTRLVSLSHVSRHTGRRFPVAALIDVAHRRGVPVLVDGAQAVGAIPVDVRALDCDFYVFGGHKYVMAPQGTGAFYVRHDRIEWLRPSWIGSRSQQTMDAEGRMTLLDSAARFEFGTRNWSDHAGFGKALEIWESIGWRVVFEHIAAYTDRLKQALLEVPGVVLHTPLPYEQSSGIVTFHIGNADSLALYRTLLDRCRILLSPVDALEFGVPGLRVAAHVFNTHGEIQRLVTALVETGGAS